MFKQAIAVLLVTTLCSAALAADPSVVHDPMRPFDFVSAGASAAVPGAPRYDLTAIVISPTRRIAVLNGKSRAEGDRVDGAEIVRIDPHSVALRKGSEELVIHLGGVQLGKPAAVGASVP